MHHALAYLFSSICPYETFLIGFGRLCLLTAKAART